MSEPRLPVNEMVVDAGIMFKRSIEGESTGLGGDLACHVLALAQENDRLRVENAELLAACETTSQIIEIEVIRFEKLELHQKWGKTNWPMVADRLKTAIAKAKGGA
jgi:hypothetical protein